MVKKQYLKSTGRMFLKHFVRLISISAIFLVTVSLVSGLGDVENNIYRTIDASYHQDNIHDFMIRSMPLLTPRSEVLKLKDTLNDPQVKEQLGINEVEEYYSFDIPDITTENYSTRLIYYDFTPDKTNRIDKLEIIEGRAPHGEGEVVVERVTKDFHSRDVGDVVDDVIGVIGCKIVGIVKNPTMIALSKEPSDYYDIDAPAYLNDIFYFDNQAYAPAEWIAPSLLITLNEQKRNSFMSFSSSYESLINSTSKEIQKIIDATVTPQHFVALSLYENFSIYSLNLYAGKVGSIATIFIVFFILIAVLVVFSSMSRLLDEDRASIATLKTLGYSNIRISMRYLVYILIAGIVGVGISIFPSFIVNSLILNAFGIQYALKSIALPVVGPYFYLLAGVILFISLLLTIIKAMRVSSGKPIELLTPKAPKVGKKILLERIKPIWNRLSFKYKSTIRNIFLFKSRLLMTILSIIASTMMVFASFSLLNKSYAMPEFASLRTISVVLLFFSGALCALVIYNIANINISERTREVATLMVLGYRNKETAGYIFREIYIMTVFGALLGLPCGVGFMQFFYTYIGIGDVTVTQWWSYLVTPIITIIFAILATLLLYRKIIKTDMNASLKVLE